MHNQPEKPLPLFPKLVLFLSAVSVLIYSLFPLNAEFADAFNSTVGHAVRVFLAALTSWIPFSLAEVLILLLPVLFVLLFVLARHAARTKRGTLLYLGSLLSVIGMIWVIFVTGFASGYYATPLDEKLGLDRREVSAEELKETAMILADELNRTADEITFLETGTSMMPYTREEMNGKLMEAYETFVADNAFLLTYSSKVKPVMISKAMSYAHITGVYSFFTGEANINVDFPDYTLPYTAAHELAHQRGIAREDEANMVAFLVCIDSDDPYIRYSGLLNTFEYVASALYSADPNWYYEVYSSLPYGIKAEEIAFSAFFKQYEHNAVATVSETVNDAYLQSQGAKEGTKSYNMVVDLTVAYYKTK